MIVLIATDETKENTEPLARAIIGHLGTLPARLEVVDTPAFPREPARRTKVAATLSGTYEASAVLWMTRAGAARMLVPDFGDEPIHLEAQEEEAGSPTWCEVIAARVHSEVSSLLPYQYVSNRPPDDQASKSREEKPTEGVAQEAPDVVRDSTPQQLDAPEESPAIAFSDGTVQPADRSGGTRWGIGSTVGYTPSWPSANGPALHGAALNVFVAIGVYVEAGLGLVFIEPVQLEVSPDNDAYFGVDLMRWPARLFVGAFVPLWRFQFGVRVGAVMEVSYLRGLDLEPRYNETAETQVFFGFFASAAARFWILSWLGVTFDFGLDIFRDAIEYTLKDETIVRLRTTRPNGLAGIVFRFDLTVKE